MADDRDLAPPLACPAGGDWPVILSPPEKEAPASAATERAQNGMESPMARKPTQAALKRKSIDSTPSVDASLQLTDDVRAWLEGVASENGCSLGETLGFVIERAYHEATSAPAQPEPKRSSAEQAKVQRERQARRLGQAMRDRLPHADAIVEHARALALNAAEPERLRLLALDAIVTATRALLGERPRQGGVVPFDTQKHTMSLDSLRALAAYMDAPDDPAGADNSAPQFEGCVRDVLRMVEDTVAFLNKHGLERRLPEAKRLLERLTKRYPNYFGRLTADTVCALLDEWNEGPARVGRKTTSGVVRELFKRGSGRYETPEKAEKLEKTVSQAINRARQPARRAKDTGEKPRRKRRPGARKATRKK